VAFAGAEEDVPGFGEDPGVGLLGTGVEDAVDLPPQPHTNKVTVDKQRSATDFEATYQTPERCNASISEQQLWLNENKALTL
jgi:hypothetical protein